MNKILKIVFKNILMKKINNLKLKHCLLSRSNKDKKNLKIFKNKI